MAAKHVAGEPTTLMRALVLPYAAVVVVALLFAWSLNEWKLLGWRM